MPHLSLSSGLPAVLPRRKQPIRLVAAALLLVVGLSGIAGCGTSNPASVLSDVGEGGSLAVVPLGYDAATPARWVIFFHGTGGSAADIQKGPYADILHQLIAAHYVVLSMNYTDRNCYGNQQCTTDVTDLVAHYRGILNLDAQPFLMADSSGGLTALNAVAAGAVHPRAMVGWCVNTSLSWAYLSGNADRLIDKAYDISDQLSYAAATSGHDPLLNAGSVFSRVPTELWSSYDDGVVRRAENTDAFAALVNASTGSVVVHTSSGNHNDQSNFHGDRVVAFFNQH